MTADAICHTLEENHIRCWYAPRDIRVGASWTGSIMDGLANSHLMILVWSAASNVSPHVTREVQHAFRKGMTVIPFRIEDIAPTKELEYYLESVQWLDASTPPLEGNLKRLVEYVRTFLPTDRESNEPKQKEAERTQTERAVEGQPETEVSPVARETDALEPKEPKTESAGNQPTVLVSTLEPSELLTPSQPSPQATSGKTVPSRSPLNPYRSTTARNSLIWRVAIPAVVVLILASVVLYAILHKPKPDPQVTNHPTVQTPAPVGTTPGQPTPQPSATEPSNHNSSPPAPTPKKHIVAVVTAGKAIYKEQPPYPTLASLNHISGSVVVKVTIDEEGNVVAANAVQGPEELRYVSVTAALKWKFEPTKFKGKPISIPSVITFNFVYEPLSPKVKQRRRMQ